MLILIVIVIIASKVAEEIVCCKLDSFLWEDANEGGNQPSVHPSNPFLFKDALKDVNESCRG